MDTSEERSPRRPAGLIRATAPPASTIGAPPPSSIELNKVYMVERWPINNSLMVVGRTP